MLKKLIILATVLLPASNAAAESFSQKLVAAAIKRTTQTKIYDPSYVKLSYPMGDIANDRGVCSDVVVRAYRGVGIDLQKLIHQDMVKSFRSYPNRWGLKNTDKNIDHRRVPNLRTFFKRHGQSFRVTKNVDNYKPGDIVSWDLRGKKCCGFAQLAHIGVVSDQRSKDGARPLIIHNIGAGTQLNDMLFTYTITGHYRYSKTN